LEVDKKHHSALIGAQGSNIRRMVLEAGGSDDRREIARTIQFPKAESDGNVVKVEGNQDVVDKIIAEMERIITERDSQQTETIDVPTEKHRSLIGRGGETKKDLESKFKVSIDIPRQGNGQTGVKITGLPQDVEKASAHILELVKEQEGETMQVPRKVHHIIWDNGRFFRQNGIRIDHAGQETPPKTAAQTKTRGNGGALPLITDDADAVADAHSWNVGRSYNEIEGEIPWVLRGSAESVAKAKNSLASAIEQALKNDTTGYLVLPDPSTYRYVIGRNGAGVKSIRSATGCKVDVPRPAQNGEARGEAIEISGSADGVEKAKDMILQAVKDGNSGAGNANGSRPLKREELW